MKPKSEERQHFFEKTVSRGVLDMKFMKRTKNKVADFKEKQKINIISDNVINKFRDNISLSGSSKVMYTSGNNVIKSEKSAKNISYIFEDSYMKLQDLSFGRKSFKGFNQEVEKLMLFHENLKNGNKEEEDFEHMEKKDVNDKEFINVMGSNKMKRKLNIRENRRRN
uniref:M-phase phosphoprotein 6 n=1 Tax=Strongyloides papillosus TaxID=174720 RepID=A0A0N5BWE4_STREA